MAWQSLGLCKVLNIYVSVGCFVFFNYEIYTVILCRILFSYVIAACL